MADVCCCLYLWLSKDRFSNISLKQVIFKSNSLQKGFELEGLASLTKWGRSYNLPLLGFATVRHLLRSLCSLILFPSVIYVAHSIHLVTECLCRHWLLSPSSCSVCAGARCDGVPEQYPGGPRPSSRPALLLHHQRCSQQPQHHLDGDTTVQCQPARTGSVRITYTHSVKVTEWSVS